MNRHDFIRRQHILEEMEEEEKRQEQEKKEGKAPSVPPCSGTVGVRILGPDDEGWS